jgi:GR25 family glycosyltransferase involved in LPS biosynthesis
MKVFVCHYTPLTARKAYLEKHLPKMGFTNIEWVTEHDIGRYVVADVYTASPVALSLRNATSFARYGRHEQRPLTKAEIEVNLLHFECYRRIAGQPDRSAVIFEDDVIFKRNFVGLFDRCINELPAGWDVLYFGKGCGGHHVKMGLAERLLNLAGRKMVFKNSNCQSRFSDSYAITANAAKKIFDLCIPFHLPIDWELNYAQAALNMNIYWTEPRLTYQGSKYGSYGTILHR